MLARRENVPLLAPAPAEVVAYIEDMAFELADFASKHGRAELAASLSIVAVQARGERHRCEREAH